MGTVVLATIIDPVGSVDVYSMTVLEGGGCSAGTVVLPTVTEPCGSVDVN